MSRNDEAINDNLKMLGDAYRLGCISREEYRARRRHVLMDISHDDDATFSNPRTPHAAAGAKVPAPLQAEAVANSASRSESAFYPDAKWLIYVLGVVILLLTGVLFWLLSDK